jgi:hypothetical protein
MFQPTRLFSTITILWSRWNARLQSTNQNLPFHLFCLVAGFFIGNIFGTFLNTLRDIFRWDGLIIFTFVILCEFISYQTYRPASRGGTSHALPLPVSADDATTRIGFFAWRPLNLMKLGVLFGFFVDAFKVGS